MTTTHIMIDLETWGTTPGSDIRSIGACVFAPQARHGGSLVHDSSLGTIRPFYVACNNPNVSEYAQLGQHMPKYPLIRDVRTVEWWNDPAQAEASAAFANPVDLREALRRFGGWLCNFYQDGVFDAKRDDAAITLWAHGPQFDVSILDAAYRAVNLPVPWHYRAPRDTRTAFDMAGITDHSAWLKQHAHGTAHHALDDAICQARAVCAAWNEREQA